MHINQFLQIAVASGASDLHLKVGSYPMMRVNGTLVVASEEKRLDRIDTEAMAQAILGPEHVEKFKQNQDVDLAYSIDGLGPLPRQRLPAARHGRPRPARHPDPIKTIDELGCRRS
jgi:twitching motility protein PilT